MVRHSIPRKGEGCYSFDVLGVCVVGRMGDGGMTTGPASEPEAPRTPEEHWGGVYFM